MLQVVSILADVATVLTLVIYIVLASHKAGLREGALKANIESLKKTVEDLSRTAAKKDDLVDRVVEILEGRMERIEQVEIPEIKENHHDNDKAIAVLDTKMDSMILLQQDINKKLDQHLTKEAEEKAR